MTPSQPLPPHRELLRIAEEHPHASLLEVIGIIDHEIWRMERVTDGQKVLYSKINGLTALRLVQSRLDKFDVDFALDAAPRTEQWLASGTYLHVREAVEPKTTADLSSICDHFLSEVGTAPVRIFDHPDLFSRLDLPSIVGRVLDAFPNPLPPATQPAILKQRTLLRRTFPPGRLMSHIGNSNNQSWHQDSNLQYNDRPMITLWIPLQDTSGGVRPGLDIMDAPASYFSATHGDSSRDLPEFLKKLFPRVNCVSIQAVEGDTIAFNGLTFHQTHTTPTMTEHRDALLIRVLDTASARHFSPNQTDQDILVLA